MKYLIFSDLHGAYKPLELMLDVFNKYNCDKIILLGDVLYHGPRNDLPASYNPKLVAKGLNEYSDKIIWIKGNCDAEVDEMVLSFKVNNYYDFKFENKLIHLEHGHHLDEYKGNANIIFYGHTHIAIIEEKNNVIYINPGSVSIPKNNNGSYIIFDKNIITLYDLDNKLISSIKI